jgi:quinol monooxygenase YgiN
MFIALYRWKLKPEKENQFREAWSQVTLAIRDKCGSLGSRLHRSEDGTWVAYAQWPNKESWQSERPLDDSAVAARQRMRDAVEESLPSLYLTVSDDYLIPAPH